MSSSRRQFNVHEAKTHLSRLLDCVAAGEEVTIAKAGRPVARLVPIEPLVKARTPGRYQGKGYVADDFNAPLPDELQRLFDGESDT